MAHPSLSLLVFRTVDVEKSLLFYRLLGLEFVQEQHGTGPIHHSCQINNIVIEIFPGKQGNAPERRTAGAMMIGFQVDNLNEIIEGLQRERFKVVTQPQDSVWGRRAVVEDIDGRAIELSQR
jgi:lactoylglutathione lyase